MVLGWMSMRRTVSQRTFNLILLVLVTVPLYTLLAPDTFRSPFSHVQSVFNPPFEINLDFDRETDLASGPVIPGELDELDPEVAPAPESEYTGFHGRPLGKHTITSDGLLLVNPNGSHPIFQLIREAEAAWEAKCARASKTLDEAVAEYRRRYRRAPPLGFDKWWDYVVKHDVQLPDEYDEIFDDIEPFWGIDPAELALTQKALEKRQGQVTVEKTDSHPRLEIVLSTLPETQQLRDPLVDLLKFVRDIEQDLPPLRITLAPFDNPGMLSDWHTKTMALEAASNGTTLTPADMPPTTKGWIQACPPDSPARRDPPALPALSTTPSFPLSSQKTFIASHLDTMNPCTHPSLLVTHGQFLTYMKGPPTEKTPVPRFSLCATLLHYDIRLPTPYGWNYEVDPDPHSEGAFEGDVPWERKLDGRLGWRGSTTGITANPDSLWMHGHRARLITFTSVLEGNMSVLAGSNSAGKGDDYEETIPVGEPDTIPFASVNPAWMDVAFVAFADKPAACDQSDGMCDEMKRLWKFQSVQNKHTEGQYKFILDVDGYGWSGRFKRIITSNALIFKATIYPEWYMSRIAPWVHYVPIQVSYVDLYDAVAFFRAHDELAARIAKAGRDWSERFWRREDIIAYLYRLLLEYARVSSLDRASMDYSVAAEVK